MEEYHQVSLVGLAREFLPLPPACWSPEGQRRQGDDGPTRPNAPL